MEVKQLSDKLSKKDMKKLLSILEQAGQPKIINRIPKPNGDGYWEIHFPFSWSSAIGGQQTMQVLIKGMIDVETVLKGSVVVTEQHSEKDAPEDEKEQEEEPKTPLLDISTLKPEEAIPAWLEAKDVPESDRTAMIEEREKLIKEYCKKEGYGDLLNKEAATAIYLKEVGITGTGPKTFSEWKPSKGETKIVWTKGEEGAGYFKVPYKMKDEVKDIIKDVQEGTWAEWQKDSKSWKVLDAEGVVKALVAKGHVVIEVPL